MANKLQNYKKVAGFALRLYFKDEEYYTSILEASWQGDGVEIVVTGVVHDNDSDHANGIQLFNSVNTREELQGFLHHNASTTKINLF